MSALLQRLNEDIALIEGELRRTLSVTDPSYRTLFDAMSYSVEGGGKRIRPVLTLEFCRLFGGDVRTALPLAAAVELVHTYSLIHDDLPCMDDDCMRRGKPSTHKAFGEATAVLAGDGLLTHAFCVIAESPELKPDQAIEAVRLLARGAGIYGMVGGQQMDTSCGVALGKSREEHEKMNRLKTGCLIRCAALLGCTAAEASESQRAAATEYSEALGLAFQVTDDLLDDGEEDGKTTFLSFYGREGAESYAKELTQRAIDAISGSEGNGMLTELALYLCDRKR